MSEGQITEGRWERTKLEHQFPKLRRTKGVKLHSCNSKATMGLFIFFEKVNMLFLQSRHLFIHWFNKYLEHDFMGKKRLFERENKFC